MSLQLLRDERITRKLAGKERVVRRHRKRGRGEEGQGVWSLQVELLRNVGERISHAYLWIA